MPQKQVSINLIGEEEMEHTPVGRIVSWAVTYGRYIMIGTEIVVLMAFISRFSLDRKLTDLKEAVMEKEDIVLVNQEFESDFRRLQERLAKIKTLLAAPSTSYTMLDRMQSILPSDVYFQSLDITNQQVSAAVTAGSTLGFTQFIAYMQGTGLFSDVEIGDVQRDSLTGTSFQITAPIKGATKSATRK